MNSVAIGTDRDVRVALRELQAVHAGVILGQLVGAQRRVEPLHVVHICVTGPAQFGNLLARNVAAKSGAHRLGTGSVLSVSSVTCVTTHSLVTVSIGPLSSDLEGAFQLGMAVQARVFRLRRGERGGQQVRDCRLTFVGWLPGVFPCSPRLPRHESDHAHRGEVGENKHPAHPDVTGTTCAE